MDKPTGVKNINMKGIIIAGIVIVIAGGWYLVSSKDAAKEGVMMEDGHKGDSMMEGDEVMMKKEDDSMMMEGDSMMMKAFRGEVISGALLEYSSEDYKKALASERLVVLYFYADWCPLCKIEFEDTKKAFKDQDIDNVVGFRVHFNDGATTKEMENLAREYGVAYQHTKVFIKNGERVLKSPETWGLERYNEEITNNLK